jgi:hypothetical protein
MNVNQLRVILEMMPPEAEVILQKDSAGNGYSPCAGADDAAVYVPDSTWSGNVYSTNNSAAEHCLEQAEWAALLASPRCVLASAGTSPTAR